MNNPNLIKNNSKKCNKLHGIIAALQGIFRESRNYENIILLSEDIRYALSYNNGVITKDDIISVLQHTSYQSTGFYLTARYCKPTGALPELLEKVCNECSNNTNFSYKDINNICIPFLDLRESVDMQAHKLGYLSRRGFLIDQVFSEALDKNPIEQSTIPLFSLYAGLLGLPTYCKKYPFKPCLFLDLKNKILLGYNTNNDKKVSVMSYDSISNFTNICIIDDALYSGSTLSMTKEYIQQFAKNDTTIKTIIPMNSFSQ